MHPTHLLLALEEVLRYDASVQAMVRTTTQTVILPRVAEPVPPGTQVLLLYGAANRDPEVFLRAHELDWQRKPGRHFGFGYGAHVCVGAPLARLEGKIALETLLQRLPNLHLRQEQVLTHVSTLLHRSYEHLEVLW